MEKEMIMQSQIEVLKEQLNLGANTTLQCLQNDMVEILTELNQNVNLAKDTNVSSNERREASLLAKSAYSKIQSILSIADVYSAKPSSYHADQLEDVLLPITEEGDPILKIMGEEKIMPELSTVTTNDKKLDGYVSLKPSLYYAFYTLQIRTLLTKAGIEQVYQVAEPLSEEEFSTFLHNYPLMKQIANLQVFGSKEAKAEVTDFPFQKELGKQIG